MDSIYKAFRGINLEKQRVEVLGGLGLRRCMIIIGAGGGNRTPTSARLTGF